MAIVRRRRLSILILAPLATVAVIAYATVYLVQPSASEAAVEAAKNRCKEHGAPAAGTPDVYRLGFRVAQGLMQEFQIDGSEPRMAIWVEVRRPLYAPSGESPRSSRPRSISISTEISHEFHAADVNV